MTGAGWAAVHGLKGVDIFLITFYLPLLILTVASTFDFHDLSITVVLRTVVCIV